MISVNRSRFGPMMVVLMAAMVFVTSCGINADNPPTIGTSDGNGYDIEMEFTSALNLPALAKVLSEGSASEPSRMSRTRTGMRSSKLASRTTLSCRANRELSCVKTLSLVRSTLPSFPSRAVDGCVAAVGFGDPAGTDRAGSKCRGRHARDGECPRRR